MAFVVITGASRGVGAALAVEFAKGGYDLVLSARDAGALTTVADGVRTAYSVRVHVVPCDLASLTGAQTLVDYCKAQQLDVTGVINNAGVADWGTALDAGPAQACAIIDLNVRGATLVALAFLVQFRTRGHGTLLNISSLAARGPFGISGIYAGSKAYLALLSDALNVELAGSDVRCLTAYLGPIETDMLAAASGPFLRRVTLSPQSAAAILFDGFVARRERFHVGLGAVVYGAMLNVLPRRAARAILAGRS